LETPSDAFKNLTSSHRSIAFQISDRHIAENELSSLTRQCLKRHRLGDIELLRSETTAWHQASNDKQRGVDWQFKIENARHKLKSIYPKILT